MSEELHEITYAPTIIDRLTRDEIEEAANLEVMDYFSSVMRAKVLACREWLANNPQGMTRDEFDALPDGTVLEVYNSQSVKVGNRGAYTDSDRKVGWVQITDHDLLRLSVVSTPPAPTLDEVHHLLVDGRDYWRRINTLEWRGPNGAIRTTEQLRTRPDLTPLLPGPQIDGDQ